MPGAKNLFTIQKQPQMLLLPASLHTHLRGWPHFLNVAAT